MYPGHRPNCALHRAVAFSEGKCDCDMLERARFLASGQNDPHSVVIEELCGEIERLRSNVEELETRVECWADDYKAVT